MRNSELYLCLSAIFMFTICLFLFEDKQVEQYTKSNQNVAKHYWIKRAQNMQKRRHLFLQNVNSIQEPVPNSVEELAKLDVSKNYLKKLKQFGDASKLSCQVFQKNVEERQNCNFMHEMKQRKRQIQEICSSHNKDSKSEIKAANLLVMKYRKLIWCPVYKAASSSWMRQIPFLTNYKNSQIKLLKQKYIQSNNLALAVAPPLPFNQLIDFIKSQKPVKFLIVRNPLERLLSAYRDKFEGKNQYFHDHFGAEIVAKYRRLGLKRFGSEFYSVNGSFNGCPLGDVECQSKRGNGSTPTFWEFVKSLLDSNISDSHWIPIHTICSVCSIDYDFILKFENLPIESDTMLDILDLKNILKPLMVHQNTRVLTIEEKQKYFNMLNNYEWKQLNRYYALDMQLFNYTVDKMRDKANL